MHPIKFLILIGAALVVVAVGEVGCWLILSVLEVYR
ncbi:hypothetical protein LCGC14_1613260 [marine sediment metagenome]|uniref:Uncharacterized protein n=1 Tax=marine sediment metagenome TaxID=412755 RepID=A0A0F9I7N0_9ZZZZ